MLYAIDAGKQVVGVDKYSTYPPDAPRTKFTGGETNAEGYLTVHPDLVLLAFPSGKVVQQLTVLHIPVLVLPPASNMAQVDQQMFELGRATGHYGRARSVAASLSAQVHRLVASAAGAGRGKTYYLELSPDYYTATSKTFVGSELSLFGMKDVADPAGRGTGYPQISAEFVLHANPYYVLLADTVCCAATPASFAHRPGFSALSAVRDHRVVGVNDSLASEWGPHTIEGFVGLVARLLRR
jgi:iron complex transport system substrate-binding protein